MWKECLLKHDINGLLILQNSNLYNRRVLVTVPSFDYSPSCVVSVKRSHNNAHITLTCVVNWLYVFNMHHSLASRFQSEHSASYKIPSPFTSRGVSGVRVIPISERKCTYNALRVISRRNRERVITAPVDNLKTGRLLAPFGCKECNFEGLSSPLTHEIHVVVINRLTRVVLK